MRASSAVSAEGPLASRAVRFEPPLDLAGSLAPLGRWGDDGLDRWDGHRLLRVVRVDVGREPAGPRTERPVAFLARPAGSIDAPALVVTAAADVVGAVVEVVRGSFVADGPALAVLCARDPVVARAEAAYRGVRPVLHRDPFTALIRSISAQQVNLTWAAEIRRRLATNFGTQLSVAGETLSVLDAAHLADASVEQLRALQLTGAKSRSVIGVARAVIEGRLERRELAALDDAALIERLVALPGIGPWSADWFLARTLGRPRVVAGDLGVRKAVGRAYLDGRMPSEAEVRELTAHWGPAAGVAQQLLLHDLAMRP